MAIEINAERFRESFEAYAAIGATENGGLHRLALSNEDREARDRFVDDLEALGLNWWIDEVGNIFGRRAGRDPDAAPVLIGSHLDSQPYGGRYDGQLGVLTALETLRALDDAGIETERPIDIVNWTNEEGARFNLAPLGSATFAGAYSVEEALTAEDKDGVTVGDELERIGYAGDEPCEPYDIHAHLELHIEQGPQLEATGTSIGVVTGVVGMSWLRATMEGEANHAGTTPMFARRDALRTAVNAIGRIQTIPGYLAHDTVITTGEFDVEPGSINVIPGAVEFSLDVRTLDDDVRAEAIERIEAEVAASADREGIVYELNEIFGTDHTEFSPAVVDVVEAAADDVGAPCRRMASGAGHDAMYVNDLADTGMIFVPSVDGISHNENEFTEWEDCITGAGVYANAIYRLATE